MEKVLVPNIRFRSFSEPWNERPFGKLVERVNESASDISLPHIEYENILSGEGRIISENAMYGDSRTGIKFEIGDVLFGKLRPYLHNDLIATFLGVAVGDFWVLRSNQCTPVFLYSLINSPHYQRIANISSGSKMPRSDWSLVSSEQFAIPVKDEQKQIGLLFDETAKTIEFKREELEKLENVKKACMERMFPREGETTPQLRFKGFTDDWVTFKLGKIGKTFSSLSGKTKEDFGHGDARFVTYMNVFTNPIANVKEVEPIEIDNSQTEVRYGDIFFTTSSETPNEVGMSSIWLGKKRNVYLNSFCFGYRLNINFNPLFIAYLFRSPLFRERITLLAQGISRFNISKNKAMEIEILMPNSISEQERIGNYFHHLDNLIADKRQEIEKLHNIKQALLVKMFV